MLSHAHDTQDSIRPRIVYQEFNNVVLMGSVAIQTFLYGIFFMLVVLAVHLLSHKNGNHSGFNTVLLLLIALMFSVSTIYLVASWFSHAYYVHYASKKFSDLVSNTFFAIQLYLPTINYLCSDSILMWRGWTIWNRNTKAFIFPFLLELGSLATILVSAGCYIKTLNSGSDENYSAGGLPTCVVPTYRCAFASMCLSFATNIAVTTLVGIKAWQYRSVLKTVLDRSREKSLVERVLAFLTESGVIYCIFWFVLLVLNLGYYVPLESLEAPHSMSYDIGQVFLDLSVQISGIYPVIIIVLVSLQKTMSDLLTQKETLPTFKAAPRPGMQNNTETGSSRSMDFAAIITHDSGPLSFAPPSRGPVDTTGSDVVLAQPKA